MQIKKNEPVQEEWLDGFGEVKTPEIVVLESAGAKKKRKKEKKKRIRKSLDREYIGSVERFDEEIIKRPTEAIDSSIALDKKRTRSSKKDSPRSKRRRKRRSGSQEENVHSMLSR